MINEQDARLDGLPVSSFGDFVNGVIEGKIDFKYSRSLAYNIASRTNIACMFLFYLGFLFAIATVIFISVTSSIYWCLLAIPVLFFLNTSLTHLKWLVVISFIISASILIIGWPYWISGLFFSIVMEYVGYSIWWSITSSIATRVILSNEELFYNVWQSGQIIIKHQGKSYFFQDGKAVSYDL